MKLPIKKKYFDEIKNGTKIEDYRDAHVTFVCEETGETLQRKIANAVVQPRPKGFLTDVLEDENMIVFEFED